MSWTVSFFSECSPHATLNNSNNDNNNNKVC